MAKKNKRLVAPTNDERASGIEAPAAADPSESAVQAEIEVNAQTFDIDEFGLPDSTRADLGRALSEQSMLAEELRFEIEHLVSRQRGLEVEVAERAEITTSVNSELRQTRSELDATRRKIKSLEDDYKVSQASFQEANSLASELQDKSIALEFTVQELTKTIESLQLDRIASPSLEHQARNEIARCRASIAEQSGKLAAQFQELDSLRNDNVRIERYADSLRNKLRDQLSNYQSSVAAQRQLESSLKAANEVIDQLSTKLTYERQLGSSKDDILENVRIEYEREIRQIRFELGAAEETLAGQETLNGQLASDLIDYRGFREALESQLSEFENESNKTIRELTGKLKRAKLDADDYARKLRIKDSAISDLMQELSKHTSKIELKVDFDNVLQKIDGYKADKNDQPSQKLRHRVARLLIGKADGRELRFPLFKDRLTIGRTSHNDIQLNMKYVSRRHAVISTELGMTRVIDWGSKNGVFVNRKQITEQILQSGDLVSIGTADFKYEERPKRQ